MADAPFDPDAGAAGASRAGDVSGTATPRTPRAPLDASSAIPLYRQIVVAMRYRIATGELPRGERLPSLRDAAEMWSVNYHTVRRAYEELEEAGLVERRRGAGTTVTRRGLASSGPGEGSDLREFLTEVREAAGARFGLSVDELAYVLTRPPADARSKRVVVVECNFHQCRDLARQIRERWETPVVTWLLGPAGEPPEGTLVGTYFHYREMRRRWPRRRHEMYFPAVHPDPRLRDRLAPFAQGASAVRLPLCERDAALAEVMARDASLLLSPNRFDVTPWVTDEPDAALAESDGPVLIAPRLWDRLAPEGRADHRAIELRYVFRTAELEGLGEDLGWARRGQGCGELESGGEP